MLNSIAHLVLIVAFVAGAPVASCCRLACIVIPGEVGDGGGPVADECCACCKPGDRGPAHAPRHAPTCDCGPAKALPPIVGSGAGPALALPAEAGIEHAVCTSVRSASAVHGVHAPPVASLLRLHCALMI